MKHTFYDNSITELKRHSKTANLIITSPPYGNQRNTTYGGVKPDHYVEWFEQFLEPIKNTLKDDGSFILNIKENVVDGERHTYVYDLVKRMKKSGFRWVDEYCWHKTTTTPGKWNNRFRDQWERLYHFTLNKQFNMYQENVMVPVGDWAETRFKNMSENDKKRNTSNSGSKYTRNVSNSANRTMVYPSNVLSGSPVTKNIGHPAAFPQWLPEWFIKLFTKEGDTIMDIFSGSGTTALAAENLGRNSINFDISKEYNDLAIQRLTNKFPKSIIIRNSTNN